MKKEDYALGIYINEAYMSINIECCRSFNIDMTYNYSILNTENVVQSNYFKKISCIKQITRHGSLGYQTEYNMYLIII